MIRCIRNICEMAAVPCLCSLGWGGCVCQCYSGPAKKDLSQLCCFFFLQPCPPSYLVSLANSLLCLPRRSWPCHFSPIILAFVFTLTFFFYHNNTIHCQPLYIWHNILVIVGYSLWNVLLSRPLASTNSKAKHVVRRRQKHRKKFPVYCEPWPDIPINAFANCVDL